MEPAAAPSGTIATMTRFAEILVPVDYSACSDEALRTAAALARAFDGRLLVLHLLPIEIYALADFPIIAADASRLAEEAARLRAHVDRVLRDGAAPPEIEVEVAWGSPHVDIVHRAVERRVDLVVVGTHGRTGLMHVLLGSVAEKLVRLAPCPVLTVRTSGVAAAVDRVGAGADAVVRRPSVRVGEVGRMMSRPAVTVAPDDVLELARERMARAGVRHLPVVRDGRLVAMLSDRDLAAHAGHLAHTKVNAAMTSEPVVVTPDVAVAVAAHLMIERGVRALPVVDGPHVVGVLSSTDILEDYVRAARAVR